MRALSAILAVSLLASVPAAADGGRGRYPLEPGYSPSRFLTLAKARPLESVGRDVIRFTAAHEMTRHEAAVIELRRTRGPWAAGRVVILERVDPGGPGWRVATVRAFEISTPAFDSLAADIDSRLPLQAERDLRERTEGVETICLDGPTYLTERRVDGIDRWQDGWCGPDHPNVLIARRLSGLLPADIRYRLPYLEWE